MEQIRAFIAIDLPQELKAGLKELQDRLREGSQVSARWVDPYRIHLTLKFLGNVAPDRIDGIARAMLKATEGTTPFQLKAGKPGAFPNPKRVQVVWIGIDGEIDKLQELQKRIELNLAPLGFASESRPFVPHLTLARVREGASPQERQKLGELIAAIKIDVAGNIRVDAINLMRSQLTREGAIYHRISSARLASPCL